MDDLRARRADVVVFWEMSRGTRHRREWAELAELAEDNQLLICVRGRTYDATDPHDMAYLDGLVTRGVEESGETRDRILRDVASQAEAGAPHGWAGYGFTREYDPRTGALLRQVLDPVEHPVVEEMARRFLAGEGLLTIAADLNRRQIRNPGGYLPGEPQFNTRGEQVRGLSRGWTWRTVRYTLMRPAIAGYRVHHGRLTAAQWPAIISEADWWTIQDKLRDPDRRTMKDAKAAHLLSGIAVCGVCGGPMYRNVTGRGVSTYRCRGRYAGASSGHVARKEDLLDAHVEGELFDWFSQPNVLQSYSADVATPEEVTEHQTRYRRLEGELAALYDDVRAGRVSRLMAQADEERIQRELSALEEGTRPRRVEPLAVALAGEDPESVRAVWESWSLERQRAALRAVTEEIRVLATGRTGRRALTAGESVRITWRGQA